MGTIRLFLLGLVGDRLFLYAITLDATPSIVVASLSLTWVDSSDGGASADTDATAGGGGTVGLNFVSFASYCSALVSKCGSVLLSELMTVEET